MTEQQKQLLRIAIAQTKKDQVDFNDGQLVMPPGMDKPDYLTKEEFNELTKVNFNQVSNLIGNLIEQIEANRREIHALKMQLNEHQSISYNLR